jgi:hypothetical protein
MGFYCLEQIMNKIKFKTKLSSSRIESDKLKDFIGKEVEISVQEFVPKRRKKRIWTQIGALELGGALDNINLRDYAYD